MGLQPAVRRASLAAATSLAAGLIIGCGDSSPTAPTGTPAPPTATGNVISLGSITPTAGTLLHQSQTVTFTATLNYTLTSAASGKIVMVIQDQFQQNLKPAGAAQVAVPVMRGTGMATLSDSITIPSAGVSFVTVFLPLVPEGDTRTDVVVSVGYTVR